MGSCRAELLAGLPGGFYAPRLSVIAIEVSGEESWCSAFRRAGTADARRSRRSEEMTTGSICVICGYLRLSAFFPFCGKPRCSIALVSCHVCDVALEFCPFLGILKGFRLTAQGSRAKLATLGHRPARTPQPRTELCPFLIARSKGPSRHNPIRGSATTLPQGCGLRPQPWAVRTEALWASGEARGPADFGGGTLCAAVAERWHSLVP